VSSFVLALSFGSTFGYVSRLVFLLKNIFLFCVFMRTIKMLIDSKMLFLKSGQNIPFFSIIIISLLFDWDINGRKGESLFFFSVPDTTRDR
jgi:hypothetical protein